MTDIAFVLPVRGGSGGAHSVMQEASALRDLGVDVDVLVNAQNIDSFRYNYARYSWIDDAVLPFTGPIDLAKRLARTNIAVATTNTSVHSIAEAMRELGSPIRAGYYVQDYEPLFYEAGTTEHTIATASFNLIPSCIYFAKTHWLCDIVEAAHGHKVELVVPSIDHGLYHPARKSQRVRRVLCAMLRPATPRRAPKRTIDLLSRVAAGEFGPVDVKAFGVSAEELANSGLTLPDNIFLAGVLRQTEVAELLRDSDFFVDLSDYQAFGRTAAEAMACGCITVAPVLGGASDFIKPNINSFLVDVTSPANITSVVSQMLSMSEREIKDMQYAGLDAVSGYTPVRAALSELRALGFA